MVLTATTVKLDPMVALEMAVMRLQAPLMELYGLEHLEAWVDKGSTAQAAVAVALVAALRSGIAAPLRLVSMILVRAAVVVAPVDVVEAEVLLVAAEAVPSRSSW
jgi:hypothetical protein